MTRKENSSRQSFAVRLCIWSVRHQSWLAGQVRIYIYFATALIAFLALADVISIETAMFSSFCGGVVVMGLIWTLIHQRKAMLLNIQEQDVRDQAHIAMLEYLSQVTHGLPPDLRSRMGHGDRQGECKDCHFMQ